MKKIGEIIEEAGNDKKPIPLQKEISEIGGDAVDDIVKTILEAKRLVREQLADIEFIGDTTLKKDVMIVKRKDTGEIILETDKESVISEFFEYFDKNSGNH